MAGAKALICDALSRIHEDEIEAVKEFNKKLKELREGMQITIETFADKRLEVLTDPAATISTAKVDVTDVQECFKEMSLKEIAGTSKPVDERYQQHGTPAWPKFWLHALMGCGTTRKRISTVDKLLLSYLRDIRCRDIVEPDNSESYEVEFYFAENPFFTNTSLKREIQHNEGEESQASTIQWKNNTVSSKCQHEKTNTTKVDLVEELTGMESGDEYEENAAANNTYGSFFDFFQPFENTYLDMKMGQAIRERVCCNPLKYARRYEECEGNKEMEDSESEDDQEDTNYESGGRYPFSWLVSLAKSTFYD